MINFEAELRNTLLVSDIDADQFKN